MGATWPEEVDCFTVPHSRMKKLVHKYSKMILTTDFTDELHFKTLLQNLHNVFMEFKAHEQIENILIMRKLRSKLKAASVTSDAVCNCHSDNRLTDMLELVLGGFKLTQKSNDERKDFGLKLEKALEDFTQNFIPHMEEEEEVFQPMLMEYFSYEELIDLKAKVINQHAITKLKENLGQHTEKIDVNENEEPQEMDAVCHFENLPNEICLKIFSYLNPRDLARVGSVSQRWYQQTRDSTLWSSLHPVQWAQGNWSFYPELRGGVDEMGEFDIVNWHLMASSMDEDADVDETCDTDDKDEDCTETHRMVTHEAKTVRAIVKFLLPHVGSGVKTCDLAYSRGVSSSLVHKILKLCPNLETLDLTHTLVGDEAFKEYGVSGRGSKLQYLDLTGCTHITDATLFSLADANYSFGLSDSECDNNKKMETEIEVLPPPCGPKLASCCGKMLGHDVLSQEENVVSCESSTNACNDSSCDCTSQMVSSSYHSSCCLESGSDICNINCSCDLPVSNKTIMNKDSSCCDNPIDDNSSNSPSPDYCECSAFSVSCETTTKNSEQFFVSQLRFLSLNGCYGITDQGLWALCEGEGTPYLQHLDLSGCVGVSSSGLESLVATCHSLDLANLFYCDNMTQDPFHTTASGCRNLQCGTRYCCTNSYKE